MATTYKYKMLIVIKDNHGVSKTIYPIIEASSDKEARDIAKAQYPNSDVRSATKM